MRYEMFDLFGLSHRFYTSPDDIYKTDEWMEPVDYTEAAQIIEEKAQYARNWLVEALSSLPKKTASEQAGSPTVQITEGTPDDAEQLPYLSKEKSVPCSLRKRMSKAIAYPVRDFFRGLRHRIIGR